MPKVTLVGKGLNASIVRCALNLQTRKEECKELNKPFVSYVQHYVSDFVHCLSKQSPPAVELKHFYSVEQKQSYLDPSSACLAYGRSTYQ